MTYEITSRREVAIAETHKGIFTGKTFTIKNNHGGQKAVCVKLDSRFIAWGFGADYDQAEVNAVAKAKALAA